MSKKMNQYDLIEDMNKGGMNALIGRYYPRLPFFHRGENRKNDCAVVFALHPSYKDKLGYVAMTMARHNENIGISERNSIVPAYDWDNGRTVFLDIVSVGKMLQVFRGECESIDENDEIIVSTEESFNNGLVRMRHVFDPCPGYALTMIVGHTNRNEEVFSILLTNVEALILCEAFASSMSLLAFGCPSDTVFDR